MKSSYLEVGLFVILITNAFDGRDAVCPEITNSGYTFGINCKLLCHCKNVSESCNQVTGECSLSGCGNTWMGPGCQYPSHIQQVPRGDRGITEETMYHNIDVSGVVLPVAICDMAFHGYAKHLDNLEYVPQNLKHLTWARKAIDGDLNTCSMTAESYSTTAKNRYQDPFWKVLFPQDELVTRLLFQTKLDTKEQLGGFQIFVEHIEWSKRNAKIFPANSSICYTHTPPTPLETTMDILCEQPLVGNHIRFQLPNKTAQIVLCDVRIYGGRELAFERRTEQSSNFSAYKAVDGSITSPNCSLTNTEQNPWWRIDFGYNINVQAIKIAPSSDSVTVNMTNTNIYTTESDVNEWVLLHPYQQSTTMSMVTVVLTSLINTRQLMISTSQTGKLGFCEIQVFGDCPSNQCGWNCEKTCHCPPPVSLADRIAGVCTNGCDGRWVSTSGEQNYCDKECTYNRWGTSCYRTCGNCLNGKACGVTNGVCPTGCDVGYKTTTLCNTKCSSGKYGDNCSRDCSGHCIGNDSLSCDHIDGSCQDGCEAGWKGSTCDKECSAGKYGVDCSKDCSGHCKGNNNSYCDRIDGSCKEGCEDGWIGLACDQGCSSGKYGSNCSKDCSGHCSGNNNLNCDRIDGSCQEGCEDGWTGSNCDGECSAGTHGVNCSKDCSGHCKGKNSSYCHHIDGSCKEGCEEGWNGLTCDTACSAGKYGVNCSKDCSGHCFGNDSSYCDHTNGSCQGGCQAGWEGPTCDQECPAGKYGINCANNCSGHCAGSSSSLCNHSDGSCGNGCEAGWNGTFCDKECAEGFYGVDCQYTCSGSCLNRDSCDKLSGNCINGCQNGYTGDKCIEKVLGLSGEDEPSSTSSAGGVAGGIVAAVVIITAVVLVLVFIRRRRQQLRNHKSASTISNTAYNYAFNDVREVADLTDSQYANAGFKESPIFNTDNEPTEYMNTSEEALKHPLLPEHAIYLSDLGNYIKNKTMNEFEEEFQDLSFGAQFSTAESLKPENRGKNRYKGLYPYDKTRVKLQTVEGAPGSDYINASFINGYDQRPIYIAAQGPTEANANDFWRMVYELKLKKIIMVTNCVEDGKMKCIKYWPDDEDVFGSMTVSLSAEEVFSDCIVRQLSLKQENETKHQEITQFHYTSWPDHGTPDNISSLAHFWQKVRKGEAFRSQTWVIHCSAGIGRTGTFIGLDYLYDEGKAKKYINAYKCVESMRDQRINMVQRKEQYKFLHEVVYEVLCSTNDPIPNEEFTSEYHRLQGRDNDTNQTYLLSEYKQMNAWTFHKYSEKVTVEDSDSDSKEDEFSAARLDSNTSKNRFPDILPPNDYRPVLSTSVSGCTDYINAVYIPMYKTSKGFIVTQNPVSSTIVDFYRMVYEKDIQLIVSFDDEASTEAVAPPQGSQLEFGPFMVDLTEEIAGRTYTTRILRLTSSIEGSTKKFQQYVFKGWNQHQTVPAEVDEFMDFLREIEMLHLKDEFRPILIKCLNGAAKSGLFCVIWNVLERMRIDGEVAIPQTIRNLRHRRQQIISNFEQYSFCYEAVLRHIRNSEIYANM